MSYLYKYLSISNLKRFLEIIYSHQIYAPSIKELNDVKEGTFVCPVGTPKIKRDLFVKMINETHVCSFSELKNNGHMFAIYGDSHKGCCVELVVTSKTWRRLDIDYTDSKPHVTSVESKSISEVLKVKSTQWGDESEVRYMRFYEKHDNSKKYIHVKIQRIMFGVRVSKKDYGFYKRVINGINKKIEVIHLTEDDIDFGFKK